MPLAGLQWLIIREQKVSHCWDLVFTDAAGEPVRATIYDWKYYDGGIARCQMFKSVGISAAMIPAQFGS